jgi:hypothetical protein
MDIFVAARGNMMTLGPAITFFLKTLNNIAIAASGKGGSMTRNQKLGAWLILTLLLALALYRWFNLP